MPMGPVRIPSIRSHKTFSALLIGKKMFLMGGRHEPSVAGRAGLLWEEGEVLVAGKCLRQEELSQPIAGESNSPQYRICSLNAWFSPALPAHAHIFCS